MLNTRHSRGPLTRGNGLYRTRPHGSPNGDCIITRAPPATGPQGRPVVPTLATADAIRRFRDPAQLSSSNRVRPPAPRAVEGGDEGVNDTLVQSLLHELVDISQSIAAYLEGTPRHAAPSASLARQGAALDAQAIERIVRRVQAHFVTKIKALEAEREELREQLHRVRGVGQAEEAFVRVRETDAACFTERQGSSEVDQLRAALAEEKRQRLRVEEQTEQLVEQHAKLVASLERRVQKQEEQLRGTPNVKGETTRLVNSPVSLQNDCVARVHSTQLVTGAALSVADSGVRKWGRSRHGSQARLSSSPERNGEMLERYRPMTTQVPASLDGIATLVPPAAPTAALMNGTLATVSTGSAMCHTEGRLAAVPTDRAAVDEIDVFLTTITQELHSLQR